MLVLTSKPGEACYLGDDITVTILGVQGNQVRLGFEAPKHIHIEREKLRAKRLAKIDVPPPNK